VGPRAGLDGVENLAPYRDSSPDRPARSESLYRLSYPGSFIFEGTFIFNIVIRIGFFILTKAFQILWVKDGFVKKFRACDGTRKLTGVSPSVPPS
jgi:hypothetical protein